MQTVLLSLAVIIVAVCYAQLPSDNSNERWANFKRKNGKHYSTMEEETQRRGIWAENLKIIESHNQRFYKGEKTYLLGENKYSDMSTDEFNAVKLGEGLMGVANEEPESYENSIVDETKDHEVKQLPMSIDWREKGYVTEVKEQGPCSSCWAFSATGSLEGQHFKATNELVSLSVSNLLDCCNKTESDPLSCKGGWMHNAFQCIINMGGINTEENYPYVHEVQNCKFTKNNTGASLSSFEFIENGNEIALQEAVATIGPVSSTINSICLSFQHYRSGIINGSECKDSKVIHAILVVGYGHDKTSGLDYWIVKNSWGADWGEDGYFRISRNKNNDCGIASNGVYPIV